jgi:glycosyltransferase involved in cell wall biosynthesis
MKILFTLNSSNFGGMEKTVLDLVQGLGFEFEKFVICPEGDLVPDFKTFSKVILHSKVKSFDQAYIRFLIKFIKENQIEVIHANEPRVVFHSMLAGFLAGVRVRISHTHTPISMWQIPWAKKFLNLILNSLVINLLSTKEIALTNSIKKQKIKELVLPNKLVIIPNCLDSAFILSIDTYKKPRNTILSKFKIADKFMFLYLSRLTKEKNQKLLIEAFYSLSKTKNDSVLVIAGKGPDYGMLKKRISALNLEKRIFILNEVSEADKIDLYMSSNCFVFPTLAEGFGITLIEAMYSCYPVISSNLEVLKEVSGNKVLFFKNNNQKSLTSKLKEALKLEESSSKLVENKKFVLANYSAKEYIENYENLYKN